jgi:hypothetical protein
MLILGWPAMLSQARRVTPKAGLRKASSIG